MEKKPAITQLAEAPKAVADDLTPLVEPLVTWTQDLSNHILHIHLPGFKRENIRVQLNDSGKVRIKASKIENINLDKSFDVPKNTILKEICARFEDGILSLFMPKRTVEEVQATQTTASEDRSMEYGAKNDILEKVNRNRKVIAVVVAAIVVGLYVSHKLSASGR